MDESNVDVYCSWCDRLPISDTEILKTETDYQGRDWSVVKCKKCGRIRKSYHFKGKN